MSKDLYRVREQFLKELRLKGLVTEETYVTYDGFSDDENSYIPYFLIIPIKKIKLLMLYILLMLTG